MAAFSNRLAIDLVLCEGLMAVKIVSVHVLARCPTRQPNLAFMEHLATVVHWILCGVVLWDFGPVWAPGHNTPLIF